jgi:Uma2 family endonuclease
MVEVKIGPTTVDRPYTVHIHGVTEPMFDELVDEDTRAELIDGVMIVHSPASFEHDDIGTFLRSLMGFYADLKEAGQVCGPDSLVRLSPARKFAPDVYFLRRARVPSRRPKEFKGAPDLVVEVLSPSNRDDDLERKRPAYQLAGVSEIWFVDPENRQVMIDRKRRKNYVEEVVTEGSVTSGVLAGFWVDVAWLWGFPLPHKMTCLQAILGES